MKKILKLTVTLTLLLSLSAGCGFFEKKKTKWRPVEHKNLVFLHEVQWEDESYEMIAKWYSGSKDNAELIINSNPALNPERLQIGDKIFIPKKILRTRKHFSRKFVENYFKKSVKKVKNTQTSIKKKEEKVIEKFELFGPK